MGRFSLLVVGIPLVLVAATVAAAAQTAEPSAAVADGSGPEFDTCTDIFLRTFVEFPVRMSEAPDAPVTLRWEVVLDGSANGDDLQGPTSGEVAVAPGETGTEIRIEIAPDDRFEGDETFTLRLTGAEGAGIDGGEATGTIEDNETSETRRLAGRSRYETAATIGLATQTIPLGPQAAVVASGADFADALAAAPLAAAPQFQAGGLLLSTPDRLHPAAHAELDSARPPTVFLVGGPAALSEQVRRDVEAIEGIELVARIGGANRFDTAARIAQRIGGSEVYVVNGARFADAVAISALAAFQQRPILLTAADRLPPETARALRELDVRAATVVGGPAAVSEGVAAELRAMGVTVDRVSGADRYATSRAVADMALAAGMEADKTWLVTGRDWPDALAAGPAAAIGCLHHRAPGILLLADGHDLDASPQVRTWLQAGTFTRVWLVGGEAVISPSLEAEVRRLAGTG